MPPAFVYDDFAITMNIPQYMLRYLLALAISLASVASAAHIHIDEYSSEEQIEQCLNFHQLQFNQAAETFGFALNLVDSVQFHLSISELYLVQKRLNPPSRAPPLAS